MLGFNYRISFFKGETMKKCGKMSYIVIILTFVLIGTGCLPIQAIPNGTNAAVASSEKLKQSDLNDWQLIHSLNIYEGVTINGQDVSNNNRLNVIELLKKENDSKLDSTILDFEFENFKYSFSLRELGYDFDYDKASTEAYKLGRGIDDEQERLAKISELKENPVDIEMTYTTNPELFNEKMEQIYNDIYVEVVNGKFEYDSDNDKVVAKEGKDGREVDREALAKSINEKLNTGGKIEIPVAAIKVDPSYIAKADRVNGVIGSAESYFNGHYWSRAKNVEVSTRYLNGVVIGPGETFSVNNYLGDTTPDKGYELAVVIVGDEEVPGYGGGVCQTSTALYQAALRADLQIVNRSGHTMKMPYAAGGLDATVDYGLADFAFRNQFDFPILIKTYHEFGRIYFEIWGDTTVKNYEVSIYNEYLYSIPYSTNYIHDSSLEKGQEVVKTEGVTGEAYAAYRRNEATGNVEELGITVYRAINKVVRRNQ